jgi:1-deoxy-D-xylulose-5-phosphate reductoisomerase
MKKKNIVNIYGSTGNIGSKSLRILNKYFPSYKINFLLANKNYKKLIKQVNLYNPNYVCINDKSKIYFLKKGINNKKTKIIEPENLISFIKNTYSDMSVLSISGYESLNLLPSIFLNTKNLGIVSKECIVSGGHLFPKLNKNSINIFPLDSEHYSLSNLLNQESNIIKKIYLTASGGPFLNMQLKDIINVSFKNALNHPKWKMGYKNSIDSATLANKCLELIEAHYLFDIKFTNLEMIIHPESLIHSVIEYKNYTSSLNYFYHDMFIPLYNFFNSNNLIKSLNKFPFINKKFDFSYAKNLNFFPPDRKNFPILKIFEKIDKSMPINLIKFNCSNEFAVNLYSQNRIKYGDIHKIIDNSLSLDFTIDTNNINNIIEFQNLYYNKLTDKILKKL